MVRVSVERRSYWTVVNARIVFINLVEIVIHHVHTSSLFYYVFLKTNNFIQSDLKIRYLYLALPQATLGLIFIPYCTFLYQ